MLPKLAVAEKNVSAIKQRMDDALSQLDAVQDELGGRERDSSESTGLAVSLTDFVLTDELNHSTKARP